MAGEYKCTLTDKSLERAKKELNEDPKNRLGAVETLRQWIEEQQHIIMDTSTSGLLPFLRTAKFSQLRARELVESNLTLRTEQAHWYQGLDPCDPEQLKYLKTGLVLPLPGVDAQGRKVIIFRHGILDKKSLKKLNTNQQAKHNVFKACVIVLSYMMFDENNHVNGFIYLNDFSGYTMAHLTAWKIQELKDMMKWQGNFAGRFKGLYYYNTGSVFEATMELLKPLMGKKFKERIRIFGNNMENVYKEVPMHMFPEEYLPDDYNGPNAGSVQKMIDELINELQRPEIRERIMYVSKKEWGINKALKDTAAPVASFRKLNVD